jgi:hypothetical protein
VGQHEQRAKPDLRRSYIQLWNYSRSGNLMKKNLQALNDSEDLVSSEFEIPCGSSAAGAPIDSAGSGLA